MPDRATESTVDEQTSKTIAKAIGERLRADVRPVEAKLPLQLQMLLDRLRAQDGTRDGITGTDPLSSISNLS